MSENLVGHAVQVQRLRQLLQRDKVPPSLCFCGPTGIGKALVARMLAKSLLCLERKFEGCDECNSCRLFESKNHPDYFWMDCIEREQSSVAEVRNILSNLALRSFSGRARVVVFDNAEHLSLQGANILLKSFEEPRPGVYFFLVSANHSRLPATLLSRCQLWHFNPLGQEEVARILESKFADRLDAKFKDQLNELALIADGSVSTIDQILSDFEHWETLKSNLAELEVGFSAKTFEYLREIGREKASLRGKLQQLRVLARQRMLSADEPERRLRWSLFLTDLLQAERLIFERNISPAYVLGAAAASFLHSREELFFTPNQVNATLLERVAL